MNIEQARLSAAEASGGTSSSVVHRTAIEAARSIGIKPARVLDFGSGTGSFLSHVGQLYPQAKLSAADIMERPATLPAEIDWHRGDLNKPLPIAGESFDVIFSIEVIEHIENPRAMLRDIFRLLKPEGVAIITTPNTGSWRSLITLAVRGHHALFDDSNYPAHITPVCEIDFTRAGLEAGFQPPRFFYTDNGTIPRLLNHYWQDIPLLGSSFKGKRYSDNFGAIFRKR